MDSMARKGKVSKGKDFTVTDEPRMPDILLRLRDSADHVDSISPDEMTALLLEAKETIEILRMLIAIQDEILLEDEQPQGHG